MATLGDVAAKAHVSKMTVSRVINHPEKVTKELRDLVYAAMSELNYQPNFAAKALANNRTQIVKLFILERMDTVEPYYMNLLAGLADALDEKNYALQLVTKNSLDVGNCDGYVVTGVRNKDYGWLETVEKPLVLYGENQMDFDYVDTDNILGTRTSTNYAFACGYTTVVFVGINLPDSFAESREKGYTLAMAAHHAPPKVFRMDNRSHISDQVITKHFAEFPQNTCFVCASDRLAIGVERAVQRQGGQIPDDYGVIGFDGVFLDRIGSPQLTTIRQPVQKMGYETGRMVLHKIEENGAPQGHEVFVPTLVPRGTTRPPQEGQPK